MDPTGDPSQPAPPGPPARSPAGTAAGAPAPVAPRRRGGCLFWAIGLPLVALVGIVGGAALSGDDEPDEDRVTLAEGDEGGGWQVDAVHDVDGQTCTFIYLGQRQSTGSCDQSAQDDTLEAGRVTIVFGRAPASAERVRVRLERAEPVEVDTVTAQGLAGRFYVTRVPGDVDAAGVPEVVVP